MPIEIVVGVNWGDEGKGRMVDYLAQNADVVVRYQGGNNAGHTVVNDFGTFKLHLIPSGIFNPNATNILGPGMVIDIEALDQELMGLREYGINVGKVLISDRATICFPFHRNEDVWEEERLTEQTQRPFGSTRRGIGPAYGDRALKKAVQIGDLLSPELLVERVRDLVHWKNAIAHGVYHREEVISLEETMEWLSHFGERIRDNICDTTTFLNSVASRDQKILFEAQLGALRDVNFGIYPYTSSSCVLSSYAPIGGGLFGYPPKRIIGVMKAFSTCVGEGPFVTEIHDPALANNLREIAYEYGAATGRPRRIGYFDAVASRYGAMVQNVTELALTKLDSLSDLDELLLCTHYEFEGRRIDEFPHPSILSLCKPVYKVLPGWKTDVSSVRHFVDLPDQAQQYVLEIERLVGHTIRYVSVGPERFSLIDRSE
jgi:adenylosuccinate synthase